MTQSLSSNSSSPSAFFTDCRNHFARRLRRDGRQLGLRTAQPAAVRAWQNRARAKLVDLLGLKLALPIKPRARRTDSVDCGDYVREHWLLTTEPDIVMPFYLLRAKSATGRLPVVLCPHGHGGGGKVATAGVPHSPEIAEAIGRYNYDYGVAFARAGLLAICPDARGFGQRQDPDVRDRATASSCHQLQLMGASLGVPVTGMWVIDLMRLIDYLTTRRDVQAGRIACAGLSGGGLQTLFLSAVDRRVGCAVVSGYFYGVEASLLRLPSNCDCNLVPHLWENFDMGDIGALIAPRPLLIETGDADGLNGKPGVANVLSQVKIARQAYRALGAAGELVHDIFPGGHRWHGEQAVPFVTRWATR